MEKTDNSILKQDISCIQKQIKYAPNKKNIPFKLNSKTINTNLIFLFNP